jgi:two-component system CheB/CheR fusion protein
MAAKKKSTRRPKKSVEPEPASPPAPAAVPALEPPAGPDVTDGPPERPGLFVAGLGASAGGLDAFKKFLSAVPADSGIAYVLLPHLDPKHKSLMVELLARHTPMPVVEAADGQCVEADRVYVLPPNTYMTIGDGSLRLTGPVRRGGPQTSIDLFLRALAQDRKEKSVGIILSGTGSHGTLGLRAVKAAGGLAVVQAPETAEYPAMPLSAIATGLADHVLPVEQIPAALLQYVREYCVDGARGPTEAPGELSKILATLHARTKIDFHCYRKSVIARRVERRMSLSHFNNLADYLAYLRAQSNDQEIRRLARDLLVGVTGFFRDLEAYAILEAEVVAPLVRAKDRDAPVRIWSVGCATGEEPYSLGMLVLEQLAAAQKYCPVQIFATDVDEDALKVARHASYPESIAADVSPDRLGQFFTRVGDSAYQVSKQLREDVTFARQDLITDIPFSRMDLVVCRNLLMNLEPEVQRRAIALLHYALVEGGYLFLGPSETVGPNLDLFEMVSPRWQIYRRLAMPQVRPVRSPASVGLPPSKDFLAGRAHAPSRMAELAQTSLLRRFSLAYVVINRNGEIVYFAGPTSDYLLQPDGQATLDLLSLARPDLATKVRAVVRGAVRNNTPQRVEDVVLRQADAVRYVRIEAEPLSQSKHAAGLLLVTFQSHPAPAGAAPAPASVPGVPAESDLARQLQQELENTREELQGTIASLEHSNEEYKASHEEVMMMNEELQSANEELETSKEELKSLNEELAAVNSRLHDKVQELEAVNNDMVNLFNATEIATVFLDTALRIKRFTPAATRLFKVLAIDVGRPIGDIVWRFADDRLPDDARQILRDLAPREREVRSEEGHWYGRRLLPYRTADNRVDGVVITFVDITERKLAADAVVRRLAAVVESSADAILSKSLDGTIHTWNRGAERLYGYLRAEAVGRPVKMLVPADRTVEWAEVMARLARGEAVEQLETERVCKDGRRVTVEMTISPIPDGDGKVVSASAVARDVTERKRTEAALRVSEKRLAAILDTVADAVITIDRKGTIQSVNRAAEQMFGYTAAEMNGQNVRLLMPSPYREAHDGYIAKYMRTRQKHIIGLSREVEAQRKDGSIFPADLAVSEIEHLGLFTGIHRDLTERKRLEREVVEVASLEQRRIGENLHDSVAQELTALNLLVKDLADTVRKDPDGASQLLGRIGQGLQRCQQDLRAVLRGLLPVAIDRQGLMDALGDLADRTQREGGVHCRFDSPLPVDIADNVTATHLYLIAQEAVHNALKHGKPRNIAISLEANHHLTLRIQCDGLGMPPEAEMTKGLGLRVMRNRAAIIGATLTIVPAEPRGTLVTCQLVRKIDEPD